LYALGALSQREACAFDLHLSEGCLACDAELKQFDRLVEVLGSAPTPVAPPPYLRDLLTARIQREAAESPVATKSVLPFPDQTDATQRRLTPARPSRRAAWLPWAVAAILLIAFGYVFNSWRTERQSLRAAVDEKTASNEENARLKDQLAKGTQLTAELNEINSVLRSQQWRIIPLEGQDPAPNSTAKVYWDVQANRWVVTAELPPPPEGKVYQVWAVTSQAKISAGLIRADKGGHGFSTFELPAGIDQLEAVAITLEPDGGSAQPTMPIYAVGKVA